MVWDLCGPSTGMLHALGVSWHSSLMFGSRPLGILDHSRPLAALELGRHHLQTDGSLRHGLSGFVVTQRHIRLVVKNSVLL